VAAGTGNVALAAARLGVIVTATDITPRMLELGRARCAAAGVDIDWRPADAATLPFDDGAFDVVASCLGVIFAPDPEVVIGQLARVLRPGGRLGLVTWGLDAGRRVLADPLRRRLPPPPVDQADPYDWGRPEVVRARLASRFIDVMVARRMFHWRFESSVLGAEYFLTASPTHAAVLSTLTGDDRDALRREIEVELADFADSGGVSLPTPYLLVTAVDAPS
jgi:SAM-dependent methyltransferase